MISGHLLPSIYINCASLQLVVRYIRLLHFFHIKYSILHVCLGLVWYASTNIMSLLGALLFKALSRASTTRPSNGLLNR